MDLKKVVASTLAISLLAGTTASINTNIESNIFNITSASAEEITGQCGENATYTLSSKGVLTISGTGATYDYDDQKNKSPFNNSSDIKSVVIDKGITSIGSQFFYKCKSLENVTVSNTVESIGANCFAYCYNLSNIVLPDNIKSIESQTFYSCYSLEEITIPKSVANIGSSTFSCCSNLDNIVIPDSVTSIDYRAFSFCISLKNIKIPNTVHNFDDGVFLHCSNLETASMSSQTNKISNTFGECVNLKKVFIPVSVTDIESKCFFACNNMTDIFYGGTEEMWNKINIQTNQDKEIISKVKIHFNAKGISELGDVNNDEKIDSKDAVLILKSYAESLATGKTENIDKDCADVNGDEKIDSKDAVLVLKYYAASLAGTFKGSISDFK